jgi:hypothetical protein
MTLIDPDFVPFLRWIFKMFRYRSKSGLPASPNWKNPLTKLDFSTSLEHYWYRRKITQNMYLKFPKNRKYFPKNIDILIIFPNDLQLWWNPLSWHPIVNKTNSWVCQLFGIRQWNFNISHTRCLEKLQMSHNTKFIPKANTIRISWFH